jgi:hypothetical protein
VLLPGVYAWLTTVAVPVAQHSASGLSRVLAVLALVALISSVVLLQKRALLGRVLGIYAFVGLSVLCWTSLGSLIAVERLDPARGALGTAGWVMFAFGWGSLRVRHNVPERDPNALAGAPLTARRAVPWSTPVVLGLSVIGALVLLVLAWRMSAESRALLGQAAAVSAALCILAGGASVCIMLGESRVFPAPSERWARAAAPLAALVVILGLGFVWALLR